MKLFDNFKQMILEAVLKKGINMEMKNFETSVYLPGDGEEKRISVLVSADTLTVKVEKES